MRLPLCIILLCTCVLAPFATLQAQDASARKLLDRVVAAVGGVEGMHRLKDVQYTYHYGTEPSLERYIFDGEISYGKTMTDDGVREQFFDGETATVLLDGRPVTDEEAIESAFFSRKTSFYWLAMMQKMADPGLVYAYGGTREVEGIPYDILDVTFEDNVGVAKDRYLLYVNPYTHLVDQFLFTVAAAGRQDPILMKCTYGTFEGGVKFPIVSQSHAAANWAGELDPRGKWGARWRSDFKFSNGFTKENIGR